MAKNHSGMHSLLKKPFVIVLLVLCIDQALQNMGKDSYDDWSGV